MFQSSKPYSAVTVQIEVLTGEQYEVEDSSGIVDLIEAIRIQSSGPTEASRALRKKLKYGNLHRQLRALTILDFLIQNAGDRFLREFADEPLLERLRIAATDSVSDPLIKQKCKQIFGQWAVSYRDTPGMERVTALYKQLPKRKQPATQAKAKVLRDSGTSSEPPMGHTVSVSGGSGPTTVLSSPKHKHSSSKSWKKEKKEKKVYNKAFNFEKEKPEMLHTLASSSVASTNLLNALRLVNRETRRVSEDVEVLHRFETCKQMRRQILRYIQHVESEEYLGSLIHANEELVTALMAFEVLDKSVDYDSDSDQDVLESGWTPDRDGRDLSETFSGISINPPKPPRPPRPLSISVPSSSTRRPTYSSESESEFEPDDDDENNPFGDRNAIVAPAFDHFEPTMYEERQPPPPPPRTQSRSRSRSPPRRPKAHGGFRWKEKRSANYDNHEGENRLERGYRNRSPRRGYDRDRDRDRDRAQDRDRDRADYRDRNRNRDRDRDRDWGRDRDRRGRDHDEERPRDRDRDRDRNRSEKKEKNPPPTKKPAMPGTGEEMIIVNVNDRLGTKAAIPCLPSDTIRDFKALVAAHIGREPHEILLKRQGERPFKDFITLGDYSIGNGVQLDLEVGTGD
ncbi:hypothetical protein P175DRAFT_0513101 [Aspergillus ochraceoroseus IBT 24754]|uniref:VHS domain-containing protein n=1 Tax=Aspergillus ochraceoroseus IBT 24754 TaxID=1392256 RepID=A0A2T5M655_9EURO|nr:uncharacterized protein P175DRAFT_0513101 [Aspergillus ochraceoroseus IBT 24754]PTU24021.1 hypothetical protein P175DRAFT_0513101 [Aspergillus ochraceoroseus IBT 24754]